MKGDNNEKKIKKRPKTKAVSDDNYEVNLYSASQINKRLEPANQITP